MTVYQGHGVLKALLSGSSRDLLSSVEQLHSLHLEGEVCGLCRGLGCVWMAAVVKVRGGGL